MVECANYTLQNTIATMQDHETAKEALDELQEILQTGDLDWFWRRIEELAQPDTLRSKYDQWARQVESDRQLQRSVRKWLGRRPRTSGGPSCRIPRDFKGPGGA